MPKVRESSHPDIGDYFLFKCPGCGCLHWFRVGEGNAPRWTWNGDFENPTVAPSILVTAVDTCHLYIRSGQIQFLSDCSHALAGQTVDMEEF